MFPVAGISQNYQSFTFNPEIHWEMLEDNFHMKDHALNITAHIKLIERCQTSSNVKDGSEFLAGDSCTSER